MTPSPDRLAPAIDSTALATTIAAYQRSRRLLDATRGGRSTRDGVVHFDSDDPPGRDAAALIHASRIARARLREVIGGAVADALHADVAKATLVRRINDRLNNLVRAGTIEPDGPILTEIIEWIVERYPGDFVLEAVERGARRTPPHSRDIIPLPLLQHERVG